MSAHSIYFRMQKVSKNYHSCNRAIKGGLGGTSKLERSQITNDYIDKIFQLFSLSCSMRLVSNTRGHYHKRSLTLLHKSTGRSYAEKFTMN